MLPNALRCRDRLKSEQRFQKLDAVKKQICCRLDRDDGKICQFSDSVRERLESELRKNEQARDALLNELETVSKLDVGKELPRGVAEGNVEVNVGDDFSRLMSCEIVIKDDKIIEIRDGICPE